MAIIAGVLARIAPGRDEAAIAEAARLLEDGQLVAFPTETVYGLGADATRPEAVARIFEAKGRPANNPLIVHVLDANMAAGLVQTWTETAQRLATAFWPGPLSLILDKSPQIPGVVTAGGATVALRAPRHPIARALLAAFGRPIAAPSANRSTSISPTTAAAVLSELGDRIPLILDGGPCEVGLESTVLDLESHPPRVLRPGQITIPELERVIGGPIAILAEPSEGPIRSPGLADRHYAPSCPARGFAPDTLPEIGPRAVVLYRIAPLAPGPRCRAMPKDPDNFARELYEALRWADAQHPDVLWIESPPEGEAWRAIRDRVRRATTY